jgi:hypothetical protein
LHQNHCRGKKEDDEEEEKNGFQPGLPDGLFSDQKSQFG